jgi:probable phosphoglycerate mutase
VTRLVLLRHAPTPWNREKRLQGRADIPLSADSRDALARLKLPRAARHDIALCSPLTRCRETASALGLSPTIDARLVEMHWGEYEGHTLAELHVKHGLALNANEARGLDFTPPGGESPRAVQRRVMPLLAELARAGRDVLAVTHRGVIRAVYAAATGWDMNGRAADDLELYAVQVFVLDASGAPRVDRLNQPLEPR